MTCIVAIAAILAWTGVVHADQYVQIPLPEFKALVGNMDKLHKRAKLQEELIQHLKDKSTVQDEYIVKIEATNERLVEYSGKLEDVNGKLELLANDPRWTERAAWAGYGMAVPIAVQVVRKLVLRF